MKPFQRASPELRRLTRADDRSERSLRPAPLVVAGLCSLGFGYLAAGPTGMALAAAAGVALVLWSIDVPAAVGIALVSSGAVAALIEGDLVRSLDFAADRPVAAALVRSGVIVVASGALLDLATTRSTSVRPTHQRSTLTREQLAFPAQTAGIAVLAAAVVGLFGPDMGGDLVIAVDRLGDGVRPSRAWTGLDRDARSAFLPVSAVAYGPVSGGQLGAVLMGAGAAGIWVAARRSRSECGATVAIWAPAVLVAALLWPGAGVPDAVALGLVGSSLAGILTRQPAGAALGGVALGLATLARPETVLIVPLAFGVIYADKGGRALVPGVGLFAYLVIAWPWWRWSSSHLDLDPLTAVDLVTVVRIGVPVLALAGLLQVAQRRDSDADEFAVPF